MTQCAQCAEAVVEAHDAGYRRGRADLLALLATDEGREKVRQLAAEAAAEPERRSDG